MQRLRVEELEAFSSFINEEESYDGKITLYSPKVKERYETYKKVFGLESAGGVDYYGNIYEMQGNNLGPLLWLSHNDDKHKTLMSKGRDIHKKAKQLGLWDNLKMRDIAELASWDYTLERTENFLERVIRETPIRVIPAGELWAVEEIIDGRYELHFFGLKEYITVPEVSFDEWVALTINYDLVTRNGNASLFNRYGISHFDRYDQEVLDRVADREIDNPKKSVAVAIYNKNDWNDAFTNDRQRQMFQEIGAHNA